MKPFDHTKGVFMLLAAPVNLFCTVMWTDMFQIGTCVGRETQKNTCVRLRLLVCFQVIRHVICPYIPLEAARLSHKCLHRCEVALVMSVNVNVMLIV